MKNKINMQLKVSKALDNLPRLDYRNLLELQGNLKSLSDADAERLRVNLFGNGKDIAPNGFIVPFFVWFEPKTNKPYIVDGHQRLRVLKLADAQPYELPYIEIQAATKKEAKQKVLLISSQYGKVSREGFEEFSLDLNLDISWLDSTTTFASFAMPELADEEFSDSEFSEEEYLPKDKKDLSSSIIDSFKLEINCDNSSELEALYNELKDRGYQCRILTL